jgi:flagellin-specific chaperone FliS
MFLLNEFKTAINILQELHEVIPNETCEIANQNLQALYSCDIVRDAELGEIREITIANMAHRRLLVSKTMTALDEVRETIPNGLYVRMSACLKRIYDFVVYD